MTIFSQFLFIWYIFSCFGIMYREKSGNPGFGKSGSSLLSPHRGEPGAVCAAKLWNLIFYYHCRDYYYCDSYLSREKKFISFSLFIFAPIQTADNVSNSSIFFPWEPYFLRSDEKWTLLSTSKNHKNLQLRWHTVRKWWIKKG
jgi:hypothetical protein